jgi:hypothetical protein
MDDRSVIEAQLGRPPRGEVSVAVRCEFGLPMVLRTSPGLETGEPFPTLYWLACPLAVRAVGRLESSGTMRSYERRIEADPELSRAYREAHDAYRRDRGGDIAESAGGMPQRVKCLHALYAHEVAAANPVGALVREAIEPLGCPGPCVEEVPGGAARVAGHPAAPMRPRG